MDYPKQPIESILALRDAERSIADMDDWTETDQLILRQAGVDPAVGFADFNISSPGVGAWERQQNVFVPGNSIIEIINPGGQMNYGGPQTVDCTGTHADGTAEVAGPKFYVSYFCSDPFNKWCLGVSIRNGNGSQYRVLRNPFIGPAGCSVTVDPRHPQNTSFYRIGANDGGQICTCFNDDYYNDNHGCLTATVHISSAAAFLERNDRDHRDN